jgi:plasmid maintenance system antidote protein VapI
MTSAEMVETMRQIGWTATELAKRLGISDRGVRRYLTGQREIPDNLADWLQQVATALQSVPSVPKDWRGQPQT